MKFYQVVSSILLTCHAFFAFTAEGEKISEVPTKSAVTVWWVIFNNPSACSTAPGEDTACGSGDLANEDAEPAAIWAAGGISSEQGKLHLTAGLYRTADPLQNLDAEIDFKGLQRGWTSPEAEIHLFVRSHGQAITEDDGYLEQISNFNDDFGGCCENQQAAPYAPNEGGQKTLYMMSDRAEIEGTRAILNRRGDLLQAFIETKDPAMADSSSDPSEASTDPEASGDPGESGDGDDSSSGYGAFNNEMASMIVILSFFLSFL